MRVTFAIICLWSAAAWAAAPTGLDLIQARYAGTWHVEEAGYDTDFSRASSKEYDITRVCTATGAVLDCKLLAEGALQGEQRFTWDAAAQLYHVEMDIGGHPQPALTLSVRDAAWWFQQDVPGPDGSTVRLRIQRQYRSATEVSYSVSYSRDGGAHWTLMSRGTEVRKDAAQAT